MDRLIQTLIGLDLAVLAGITPPQQQAAAE
jgi:hypothetical protein